ncbi:hypothetical protein [Nocardia iowensis]|uniref:Uncharacterized protein n=1 Tax=Nocardia iowensis TaxID=204891 RepID=A0ABX8RJM6_NOCIO|nr:hypothetical protein [Nocardia iowensis]QXN88490.1 hypothetical protein KV110_23115 [Nocardia iowensis]
MAPYELKKATSIPAETRKSLYRDASLNQETLKKMCQGMKEYTKELKQFVIDLKGDIKPCCTTEKGLEDFFKDKLKAFQITFQAEDETDAKKKDELYEKAESLASKYE